MSESILNQDCEPLMLIVVDNDSHNGTPIYFKKMLNDVAIEHFIIRLPKNYGYTGGNSIGGFICHASWY
jgi:glycosyltransferase involved in cell wall biosynthesis